MIMESIFSKVRDLPSSTDIVSLWLFACGSSQYAKKHRIWTPPLYICTPPHFSAYTANRYENIENMHTTRFGFCGSTRTCAYSAYICKSPYMVCLYIFLHIFVFFTYIAYVICFCICCIFDMFLHMLHMIIYAYIAYFVCFCLLSIYSYLVDVVHIAACTTHRFA